ncbi:NAD(P)-dependent oxidoreductase [Actinoplanes couchii]|uniref:6-phosphogluconate dehydrogenase NADP-binding domain-containing protein n=1 Tax=Actinoplanes couchii TaxID=403638 RepID=A0ABQ3XE80_9ACTN|nr:NAD(P)-dependent oxidoreductase [Actinoplanes couchii]MDR6317322.1 3-hydroxyisobutyrate dehydrogenase [Actinoplanes couchii]GID56815.1 hypothetical protein Aco03nite_052190 [Actinoplanes couchii]
MLNIAVLGLGHMGTALAARLVEQGHPVRTWNRTPGRRVPGAEPADSPALACADADVVITMLTDESAVRAVLAEAYPRSGTTVIEMSTIGPDGVRRVADSLPAGVSMIDAPVAGSVGAATSGTLRILAGGDPATVDRVEPVLAALGTVHRCGPLGRGAAYKLILNTATITGLAVVADAVAVARAVGVARPEALALLAASPLAALATRAAGGPGSSFAVTMAAKDLNLARAATPEPLPAAEAAATLLTRAASAGQGAADISAITGTRSPAPAAPAR